jgi:hypothetical protein
MVGKPEEKRVLETQRHRWEDVMEIYLREIGRRVWSRFTWIRIGSSGGLL